MKTGVYSLLFAIVSNAAIALCFVPFLFLGWKKMRQVRAYLVVGIYWLINGLINLPTLDIFIHNAVEEKMTRLYNLVDTPLVLLMFLFAASGRNQRRHVQWVLLLFTVFEIALLGWKGYNFLTSAIIIGAGLLVILIYCITGLVQYMRNMEHTSFENSMVCVYAALLFAYGSFLILYVFIHIRGSIGNTNGGRDSFLLYYISLLLSAAVTSLGLWGYGIRPAALKGA